MLGLVLGLVLGPGLGLELVLRSEPELALWLGLGLGPARKPSKLQPQQVSLLLLWVHDLSDLDQFYFVLFWLMIEDWKTRSPRYL